MATGLIAPIAVTAVIAMVLLMTNKRGPAVRREENPLHQASALAMGGRVIELLRDGEVARFAGIRDGVEWTLRVVSTDDEETFRNTTLIRASESVRADRVLAVMGNDIDTSPSKWSWLDGSRREIAAMTSPDTIRFDGRKRLHVPGEQQTHVDQASASSSLPSPAYPRVTQGKLVQRRLPSGSRHIFIRGNEDFGPNFLVCVYPDRTRVDMAMRTWLLSEG